MKTQFIQTILPLAGATLLAMGLLVSCQDTEYPAASPSTAGPVSTSAIVVNASNATGISTLLQNTAVGSTLAPGAYTAYSPITVGSSQVRIKGSGGTLGTNDASSQFTFLPNTAYTIFVTDSINRPKAGTDAGGVRFVQVTDTLTAPAAGTARVRFFNFSPDVTGVASSTVAGPVSARLINSAGASAGTFTNRAYRTATGTALRYTVVPAGAYVTQVYSGTTVPSSLTATPIASSTVSLSDGKIYTLYSRGLVRDKSITVGSVQHN